MPQPSARLHVILARDAPRGVILRRGPSKEVLQILWHTDRDTFEIGQWFRGHIYERRCDLSPRGDKFIYFAGKFKGPFPTWTAISRPPFFTALTLWPEHSTYGGGGMFDDEHTVALNYATAIPPAPSHPVPHGLVVRGRSERFVGVPIEEARAMRDGWSVRDAGRERYGRDDERLFLVYEPPRVLVRPRPARPALELHAIHRGIHAPNGPWHVAEFQLVDPATQRRASLERCEWADWDRNGDLLFAREGVLLRLAQPDPSRSDFALSAARKLADFRALKFEHRIAPDSARRW